MIRLLIVLLVVLVLLSECVAAVRYSNRDLRSRCTTIAIGRNATYDGSVITTHNNDCTDCDFRVTHVPARDWPRGSRRPIHVQRWNYPRYLEIPGVDDVHGPDYAPNMTETSIANWNATDVYAYIDQVPHTYAYTMGVYGLQNEKQVSLGESTCGGVFLSKPTYAGGKSIMHLETLMEIALERCDTARCAVQLIGDLSTKYGFFSGDFDSPPSVAVEGAGEALSIADPKEAWIFHILADDTGSSAIWAAQRVPDNHIAVVANQFVIGNIDLSSDDFMASENIYEVAERNNLWSSKDKKPLHFSKTFGVDFHRSTYGCSRRVWRVFTMAAPSLSDVLSPYTDGMSTFGYGKNFKSPYPFSVPTDKRLKLEEIMRFTRDQYEGTEFDLTTGADSGPFGDPTRFVAISKEDDKINGVNSDQFDKGLGFGRAISLWRTTYASVTQSRDFLPDSLGAVTWIAPYAPHHSTFVPVYATSSSAPSSLNRGTLYKVDKHSNWWVHCVTSNYISRWYRYTIDEINEFIRGLEKRMQKNSRELEKQLLDARASIKEITVALTQFQEESAKNVLEQWWDFFFYMVGKYRDTLMVNNPHAPNFSDAYSWMGVQRQWLEIIGYWGVPGSPPPGEKNSLPLKPINVPTYTTAAETNQMFPQGILSFYPTNSQYDVDRTPSSGSSSTVSSIISLVLGVAIGAVLMNRYTHYKSRQYYEAIP